MVVDYRAEKTGAAYIATVDGIDVASSNGAQTSQTVRKKIGYLSEGTKARLYIENMSTQSNAVTFTMSANCKDPL